MEKFGARRARKFRAQANVDFYVIQITLRGCMKKTLARFYRNKKPIEETRFQEARKL